MGYLPYQLVSRISSINSTWILRVSCIMFFYVLLILECVQHPFNFQKPVQTWKSRYATCVEFFMHLICRESKAWFQTQLHASIMETHLFLPCGSYLCFFQNSTIVWYTVPPLKTDISPKKMIVGRWNFLWTWSLLGRHVIFWEYHLILLGAFSFYTTEKWTWNLKITPLKRKIIFQISILGFHVNFRRCKGYRNSKKKSMCRQCFGTQWWEFLPGFLGSLAI